MLYVLGNACRDITLRVEVLPAPGETLNARATYGGLGGKGLNQAIAASRAGTDVRLIAAVGGDAVASMIRNALEAERIPTDTLIEFPGETDFSVIIVGSDGENMIVTNASQSEKVTGRDVDIRVSFSNDDALLLQGNLLPGPTLHAAKRARDAGAKVSFNAAPYQDWCKAMSSDVDALILNSIEAARWTGIEDPEHAIRQLAVPLVIVTRGSDGCLLRSGGEVLEFSAPRSIAEDTSGAGDIFVGVFAAEWFETGDAGRAVRLALAAASDSVTRRGTLASFPNRERIRQLRTEIS